MLDEATRARLSAIEANLRETRFPPQVVVETTAFCNFRCSHCNHKELARPKGFMEEALFRKIIDEIVREAPETEVWPTFYGEAFLLREKLFEWLSWASERGAKNLVLNSNGSLLHKKDWTDRILTCGLKRLIFSLDGFEKETFERIRYGGDRDRIFASVERLLERKRELGLEYPVIQCQFSLMAENAAEFPAFKAHWESRGAEVKSRCMLSWSNSGSVTAPNLDYESSFRIACPWGNNSMAIHWNGDVVTCAVDCEGRHVAANVRDMTVLQAWQGPLRRLRELQLAHRWSELPEICRGCPDWQAVGATYHEPEKAPKEWSRPFWFDRT